MYRGKRWKNGGGGLKWDPFLSVNASRSISIQEYTWFSVAYVRVEVLDV